MTMFPVVEVSGDAFERGRQHGEMARARVELSLANYARLFSFNGMAWEEAQRRSAGYRGLIGGFDAALLEEMEGIASGAGRPFSEILALNARTEVLPPTFLTGADAGECTAIAVSPAASATGGTLLAQNWDWIGSQREAMILLRVRAGSDPSEQPACLTLTEAGMLAKIGFNSHGVGVCLNILRSVHDGASRDGKPVGVPTHVLLRSLLKRSSVRDAIALCSTLSFGGSSNILCADPGGESASLEFSPKGLRVVRGDGATLCHTNHFLHPEALDWQARHVPNLSTLPRLERAPARRFAAGARDRRPEAAVARRIGRIALHLPEAGPVAAAASADRVRRLGDHGSRARRHACRAGRALACRVPADRAGRRTGARLAGTRERVSRNARAR